MFAKRLFHVSAAVLLLALAYHLGVRTTSAAPPSQEVAVLAGEVPDGGTIPLPHYQDGSEALESECRWLVSLKVRSNNTNFLPNFERCDTDGRTVHVYWCQNNCSGGRDCTLPGEGCGTPAHPCTANYIIIATRNTKAH
jgi:hypothetical protein